MNYFEINNLVSVMKNNFAVGILAIAALLILFPSIAQSQIQYRNYGLSVTVKDNSSESGMYNWEGIANGHGFYVLSDYAYIDLEPAPFIQWETPRYLPFPAGWVLENGVDGEVAYLGSGAMPGSDTSNVTVVSFPVAKNVDITAKRNEATTEPVNVVNGGMFFDETDFGASGSGFGLEWTRSYNSALISTNGLGFCWTHNYDWNILFTTNLVIQTKYTNAIPALILNMGGGTARTLLQDVGADVWRSSQAPVLIVTKTSQGEYALNLPSGYNCLFGTNTFIKSISNSWGQALGFTYTNSSGSILLNKVTHSDGRALSFSYTGNRLSRVDTPSTNLCFLYYFNAIGEMTGAVTRSSAGDFLTSYTYDTNGVHAMLQHQNPLGEVFNYTYATNASGQVTPKCIKVDVATNYYEHTVAYNGGGASTVVAYTRPGTNASLSYRIDPDVAKRYVTSIIGPGGTGMVHKLDHDAVSSLVTNEVWESRPYYEAKVVGGFLGTTNSGSLNYPQGIALDWQGRLWVADTINSRVQRYTPSNDTWESWGQWGTNAGQFKQPGAIVVDASGNVYVADSNNNRIQKRVATNGQWIIWGGPGTNPGQFQTPEGIAVDSIGRVYVVETPRVQRRDTNGTWSVLIPNGYTNGAVRYPWGIHIDAQNNLYVSDYGDPPGTNAFRVFKFTLNGAFVEMVGSQMSGGINHPGGMTSVGDELIVANCGDSSVLRKNGSSWKTLLGSNVVSTPCDVEWDAQSKILYIADTGHDRILMMRYPTGGDSLTNGTATVNWWDKSTEYITARSAYNDQMHMTNYWSGYCVTSATPWTFNWNTNIDVISSVVDPLGNRSEWDYVNGSVSAVRVYPITNQAAETRYAYSSKGVLSAVTNANGHWVSYDSDSYGYPTQTVSQGGTTNWMNWNVLGHLQQVQLPSSIFDTNEPANMIPRVITFEPNELGWVKKITYPDSSFETFAYNSVGDLTNHVDVAGRTNILSWLPTKKLASTTRYLTSGGSNQAVTIGVTYDQQMNVLNIKDELGRSVESYQLDLQDRPVTVTNIEGQVMTIKYGLGSMVKNLIRFDGSMVIYGYDEGARLNLVNYGDANISFKYLKNGLLSSVSNSFGIVSNAYDGANRLVSSKSSGLLPQPATVNYGYYPAGQVSNVVSLAGANNYGFDADERITTQNIVAPNGHQDSVSYSYDPANGQLAQVTYSNGITCVYGYDILDRLTGISWRNASNQVLRSRSYSYTNTSMISRIDLEDGGHVDYSYDSLDRLTREKCVDVYGQITADTKYEFDLAGNRTKKVTLDSSGNPFITVGYTLGTVNRLASKSVAETNLAVRTDVGGYASETIGTNDRFGVLWISNAVSGGVSVKPEIQGSNFWTYGLTVGLGTQKLVAAIRDMAGNVTRATNSPILSVITNSSVKYNSAGCVTNITGTGPGYTKTVGLTWNSQYQVTTVTTNGGLAGSYKYDALGRRSWAIENGSTNWMVYDGVHVVADLNLAGGMVRSYVWGPGVDNMLSMTVYGASTNTYYAIKDHLGSVLAMTDGAGNIVESYRYDAWGRTTVYSANGVALKSSAIGNRYCWQGREYNFQTGLYYFRARFYDPVAGRWLSNDPLGIAGGLNQFQAFGSNPINFKDAFGLCQNFVRAPVWASFLPGMTSWEYAYNSFGDGQYGYGIGWTVNMVGEMALYAMTAGQSRSLSVAAQELENGMVTVSRWGRKGLQAGDWVMNGRANWWNYIRSGKWDPFPWNQFAKPSSGQTFEGIAERAIRTPQKEGIIGKVKAFLLGQRQYLP